MKHIKLKFNPVVRIESNHSCEYLIDLKSYIYLLENHFDSFDLCL